MTNKIQQSMFSEMKEKRLFEKAGSNAFRYIDTVPDRNVYPSEQALADLANFEENMPEQSGNAEQILSMLDQYGSPATVTQTGGRYFGFVIGSTVPAGLAAKHLATYWDQNSVLNVTSPISSKLESVVEGWLKELLNLPEEVVAGFVSGTSMANFCGLAAARFRLLKRCGWDVNENGLFGAPPIRVVAGTHAHSTVLKTISLLGFGKQNIEWVDTDEQGRVIADLVPKLDDRTLLILQAGNVNSGSFDPINELCERANKVNAWVHIDGAFGLWAAATDGFRHLTHGLGKANSWAVDGHKTLNTPYDSGIVLCNDQEALVSALHMEAGYIQTSSEKDGMFYTPEMSRRARVIELWATMKYLGKDGINEMISGFHLRAKQFAKEVAEIDGFEVLNDVVFNQVILKCANDELTQKVISKIQDLRECWVGGSTWENNKVIRVSVCSWVTTEKDISRSVASFKKAINLVMENQKDGKLNSLR